MKKRDEDTTKRMWKAKAMCKHIPFYKSIILQFFFFICFALPFISLHLLFVWFIHLIASDKNYNEVKNKMKKKMLKPLNSPFSKTSWKIKKVKIIVQFIIELSSIDHWLWFIGVSSQSQNQKNRNYWFYLNILDTCSMQNHRHYSMIEIYIYFFLTGAQLIVYNDSTCY